MANLTRAAEFFEGLASGLRRHPKPSNATQAFESGWAVAETYSEILEGVLPGLTIGETVDQTLEELGVLTAAGCPHGEDTRHFCTHCYHEAMS